MKYLITLILALFLSLPAYLQDAFNFWYDVQESAISLPGTSERSIIPDAYRSLRLDYVGLKKLLANAPDAGLTGLKTGAVRVDLPMPDGSFQAFEVWESSVMQTGLQQRFPGIRSFVGRGIDNPALSARLDYGLQGFHAAIRGSGGTWYIDPYAEDQLEYYISYNVKDHRPDLSGRPAVSCGHDLYAEDYPDFIKELSLPPAKTLQRTVATAVDLRTYIIALACTGEYGAAKGGTVNAVLSTFNTAINRVNLVYNTEVAVNIVLHEDTDRLIFLDPNTDPYFQSDVGGSLLGQNPNVINARLNSASYDIGHVFTQRCSDVGGVAGGTVCSGGKARGVTCHFSGNVEYIAIEIMAHEVGHQFSVSHSWDNCPGIQGQRASGRSFEPGSGSTIMSYSGSCGAQNIQGPSDDYYSIGSLEQFIGYSREGFGSSCGTSQLTDNNKPEIDLDYPGGFFIPISTPFQLMASATDPDGDDVTYNWEQYNLELSPTDIGFPKGSSPMFRSYRATQNPVRYFPRLDVLLGDRDSMPVEILADYSRDFNFKVTVRDNHPLYGGTVWEEVAFHTTENSGPFRVLFPSADSIVLNAGEEVAIEWDVANSDVAPVKCREVNILLSMDGGYNYPITLAANTPNDGSEKIFLPNNLGSRARVKVEAADNIFYNISENDFNIDPVAEPGYTLSVTPSYYYACLPSTTTFSIETGSLLNYDSTIQLEITSTLPQGAMASLDKDELQPGENAILTLTLDNGLGSGFLEIELMARAENGDTVIRTIGLDLISNDFSAMALEGPVDGASGIDESPTFTWQGAPDAELYEFQLATNPAFGADDIVFEASDFAGTSISAPDLLDENQAYYWRVRPYNVCGVGDYLRTYSFHTLNKDCSRNVGLDGDSQRIPIAGTGTPNIESTITVLETGVINDLNVPNIRGSYEPVNNIRITLVSPSDSVRAILFEQRCIGNVFNFGFDDAVDNRNPCPPADGKVRGPQDFLSRFNGQPVSGTWKLQIDVLEPGAGGGGSLEEWTLEFCADFTPSSPYFLVNDTLPVKPSGTRLVSNQFLQVQDDNDSPQNLTFTLVTIPEYGRLYLAGNELKVGDHFRQNSINVGNLLYEHNGDDNDYDHFYFTVEDSEGGWLATPKFNIAMDEDAVVSVNSPDLAGEVKVFPNPASDELNITLGMDLGKQMSVSVFNLQGQLQRLDEIRTEGPTIKLNTSFLNSGMYFLHFDTEKGRFAKKFVIKR